MKITRKHIEEINSPEIKKQIREIRRKVKEEQRQQIRKEEREAILFCLLFVFTYFGHLILNYYHPL